MALLTKEIVDDTPSDKVENLRLILNALLVAIDASTDYATLKSGILAACNKLLLGKTPPAMPYARKTPTRTT